MRVGLLAISIVMLCILGCQSASKGVTSSQTPPLASLAQLAERAGFRVFDFPRDTFKPGTITQIDSAGSIVRTPAGSLQECQEVRKGKGKELSLKVHRGRGPSGNFEALDTSGAQVDLQMLEQILPVHFGATAKSAAYVVMKVPATSSEYLGSIQIEKWMADEWEKLPEACRNALTDPGKAIVDEVLYADKGFELSFLNADLKAMDLATVPFENLVTAGAEIVGARIEANRMTFKADLPYWYTLYRSCRYFDPARLAEEAYRRCVRELPAASRQPIFTESVRRLKNQYASMLDAIHARELSADEFNAIDSVVNFRLAIDPHDGHGWYYRGEVQRLRYRKDRNGAGYLGSHSHFYKYVNFLEVVSREGSARPSGCADHENGYCQERTAWVSNLLALDFYRIALTKPEEKRKGDLCQAVKHAEGVLKLRKQGFRDPLQGVPTQDLLDDARKQLAGLGPCQ